MDLISDSFKEYTMKTCEVCNFEYRTTECPRCLLEKHKEQYFKEREEKAEKSQSMPSLLAQAKNFAKSAIRHVSNGMQNAPQHVVDSRLEICGSCEHLNEDRCSKCGCFVAMKASWAAEECPIQKWGQYIATKGKCGGCGRK